MFFRKSNSLEKLESRLIDATARQEALSENKDSFLADLLQAQDVGGNTAGIQKKLDSCRNDIELVVREIELLKTDIVDFHRRELDKEFAALPKKAAEHLKWTQSLIEDGRESLEDALCIFQAIGGNEYSSWAETIRGLIGPIEMPEELAEFVAERSRLQQLRANSTGQYREALLFKKVAGSANRCGIKILPQTFRKLPDNPPPKTQKREVSHVS